ncbi:HlyD family secretion protein [Oceanobacter mangrovi]|uniref:HlyD family secretion protein n=1 Tax=Oceanobacter mangrovi TaxID=2862510 RepID=UPI001C8E3C4C|nr:HlyD family secretion protein [Oceanobacter mangrovi]
MKFKLSILAAAVVVVGGAILLLNHHESENSVQSTDDAYVQADLVQLAPRIQGQIATVNVADFQVVKEGDLLVQLDDAMARANLAQNKADVEAAAAAIASLQAGQQQQRQTIAQYQAALQMDEARLQLAKMELDRFSNLAQTGAGSHQDQQKAAAQYQVEVATGLRDQAALAGAQQQLVMMDADILQAQARLERARALQQQSELQLSYTRILAPMDGVVAERAARVGAYVQPGQALLTLVPSASLYVQANYRETQLAHVTTGQPVEVEVDALPGKLLKGEVERLGPASGVSLAAVPAHNATGNFTKIVQRLPVRIRLLADQPELAALKVGMSVETRIQVGI